MAWTRRYLVKIFSERGRSTSAVLIPAVCTASISSYRTKPSRRQLLYAVPRSALFHFAMLRDACTHASGLPGPSVDSSTRIGTEGATAPPREVEVWLTRHTCENKKGASSPSMK